MKYDAIIFDIDGTLWNACVATASGWNKALKQLCLSQRVISKDIERVAGNPLEHCIEILLPGLIDQYPALPEILSKYEGEAVAQEGGKFYDGVINGVKSLSTRYQVFLVSNCQAWYLHLFLNLSGLRPYFKKSDCYGMSQISKHQMLINLKCKYSLKQPVYIGDTNDDELAARLAGIDFMYVSYGFGISDTAQMSFSIFDELVKYFNVRP